MQASQALWPCRALSPSGSHPGPSTPSGTGAGVGGWGAGGWGCCVQRGWGLGSLVLGPAWPQSPCLGWGGGVGGETCSPVGLGVGTEPRGWFPAWSPPHWLLLPARHHFRSSASLPGVEEFNYHHHPLPTLPTPSPRPRPSNLQPCPHPSVHPV